MTKVANFIAFQVGWFACILGAARGMPVLGPAVVLTFVSAHLVLRRHRLAGEITLLALAAVLGYAMDSALVAGGALSFPEAARWGGPSTVWMVALWVNLAATLRVAFGWLAGRYVLSAVLGALAGPLSYWAGARLGAVTFGPQPLASVGAIAVEWLIAMPLLVWLARRTDASTDDAPYRFGRVEAKA